MSRPVRPSDARERTEAAREAVRLEAATPVRLVLEIAPSTRKALRIASANAGITIREFVLRALKRDGVE